MKSYWEEGHPVPLSPSQAHFLKGTVKSSKLKAQSSKVIDSGWEANIAGKLGCYEAGKLIRGLQRTYDFIIHRFRRFSQNN
jgi:hypothetical protein